MGSAESRQRSKFVKACRTCNSAKLRALLEENPELINYQDPDMGYGSGYTALHWACSRPELDPRFLLRHGADVNASATDRTRPLHLASSRGSHDIVKLLLEQGAEVDARDYRGYTALHSAADKGYVKVLQVLLEYGADRRKCINDGGNAYNLAQCRNWHDAMDFLRDWKPSGPPRRAKPPHQRLGYRKPPRHRKPPRRPSPPSPEEPPSSSLEPHSPSHVDFEPIASDLSAKLVKFFEHTDEGVTRAAPREAAQVEGVLAALQTRSDALSEANSANQQLDPETARLLAEKRSALEDSLQRAELEHGASMQRAHIHESSALQCFYEGLKLLLNCAYLSSSSVLGGFVQRDDGGNALRDAGSFLEELGYHVPFAGLLFSLLGKGFRSAGGVKQAKAICAITGMASSSGELETFVECVARELTLEQEPLLLELGAQADLPEAGFFSRLLSKAQRKVKGKLAMSPVSMFPAPLRDKVEGDAAALLQGIVRGRLPTPVGEAVVPSYVDFVLAAAGARRQRTFVSWTQRATSTITTTYQPVASSPPPTGLEEQVRAIQAELSANREALAQVSRDDDGVAALQAQLKRMAAELQAVKKQVGTEADSASHSGGGQMQLSARPEDVERVESVKVNLAQLHHELDEIRHAMSEVAELPDRLDNVEARVDSVETSTSSSSRPLFGVTVHRQADADVAALRAQLAEQEQRFAAERRAAEAERQRQAEELAQLKAMIAKLAD